MSDNQDINPLGVKPGEKKKLLITTNDCEYCKDFKSQPEIKKKLESGEIIEIPTSDDEKSGEKFEKFMEVLSNNIDGFPTLIEAENRNGRLHICEIEDGKKLKCRVYEPIKEDKN